MWICACAYASANTDVEIFLIFMQTKTIKSNKDPVWNEQVSRSLSPASLNPQSRAP